jgi:NTE family protein
MENQTLLNMKTEIDIENKEIIIETQESNIETQETNIETQETNIETRETNIENKEDKNISSLVINNFDKSINEKDNILKFKTLCFSGGGVKGIAFIGALEKLLEKNIFLLSDIKTFVGTSAGAMISFLLNLGWSVNEIKDFVLNFNFNKLTSEVNSISFFENFGIQDGDRIQLLFIKFLESKLNVKDITFEELYNKTGKKLLVIGTNITKSEEVVFSYKTTPNFSVILALRISVSIPIIFKPVKYENEFYVDGGVVNNFPINHCSKKKTIGFYIKNSYSNEITSIKSLITSILGLVSDTISQKNIKKYKKNIIEIINTEYTYTKFDISTELKLNLIKMGYNAADQLIKNYN